MDRPNPNDESRRLRETIGDLVALSELADSWSDLNQAGIIGSLANALLDILDLELIYIRLADSCEDSEVEVFCSRYPDTTRLEEMRESLLPLLAPDGAESPETVDDPSGEGTLRVDVTEFSVGDDRGVLLCGSGRADFPDQEQGAILGVGARQAALAIERWRADIKSGQAETRLSSLLVQAPFSIQSFARHQTEQALRESQDRLNLALQAADLGHWELNLVDHTAFRNLRHDQIFGYDTLLPEWTYEIFLDHVVEEEREEVDAKFQQAITEGVPWDFECQIRRADGEVRWIWARGRLFDDDERPRMAGTVADITDRKRLEEELRLRVEQLNDADRRKDEFLATLAHELRNPLAPIRTSLEILKMPEVNESVVENTRNLMERQVHHLVRLVDDLLDVSRVMRNRVELRKEPVELSTVVDRALETAQPLIDERGHDLEISQAANALLLNADLIRLTQVVGNLLTNAAKYTDVGGCITLTTEREGQEAVLRVKDTGIGITAEALPSIFELFMQADHATTRTHGGLGLGLTLVENLIKSHGGTVEAHSEGLGKGSEFVIRLPLLGIEPAGADEDLEEEEDFSISDHRLLVVDDNQDAATTLGMLLELRGHQVHIVHNGHSALKEVDTFEPELIFLDIGMPGMDGYEVARRIRATPQGRDIIIVAVTGWGQDEDRRRTSEAGFDHHLVKPLDPEGLGALLGELIGA